MNHDHTKSLIRPRPAPLLTVVAIPLIVAAFGLGCTAKKTTAGRTATLANVDPKRARRAPVVLRVERVAEHGGSKYHWVTVKPLRVLKDTTKAGFTKPLRVAYYGGKKGVPAGISTLYLEPYGDGASGHWRLLDGDGAKGVSHRSAR